MATLRRKHDNSTSRRVGRGIGSKRGKTSGRGVKGQKARAGHRIRPELRDLIKKMPKLRGRGKNINTSARAKAEVINVASIATLSISEITPLALVQARAINRQAGKVPAVKILGEGEISRKVVITDCTVSASARKKIEAAGGSIN
jgi:large subunit ribosomal protein L15